jgi:putative membrane protein
MSSPIFLEFLGSVSLGYFFLKLVLNAAALFAAAYLLRGGVYIKDFTRAVIVALVLAFLNSTLGAILKFITLPITFLTLGLFSLVINAVILMIAEYFIEGFKIKSFVWALVLAAVLALFNGVLHFIFLQ